jgi:choline dehydrogenase-like flavoprotein/predicted dehydrogenase
MSVYDLRETDAHVEIDADLCIVGSGPAGMSVALQFEGTALRVCMIESGGFGPDRAVEALNAIESVGVRRASQDVTRCRGLGGTSALWTGRCGAFDPMDFQARPWLPDSGWPISHDDIAPYFDRAGRLLGLGPAIYDGAWADAIGYADDRAMWDPRIFRPVVFQYSQGGIADAEPARTFAADGVEGAEHIGALQHAGAPRAVHFGEAHAAALRGSRTIDVWLNANVTSVETNEAGTQARSVAIRSLCGKTGRVRAPFIVLACGGIDNARLLLASRDSNPGGVGNAHDRVGRYLTDHPLPQVASYVGEGDPALRRRYGHRWLDLDGRRHVYSLGLRLSPVVQRSEGLLNCAVHLLEYGEQPATVSIAGRFARALRQKRFDEDAKADLKSVARDPLGLLNGVYDRYVMRRPALAPTTSVTFCCAVEQKLDPDSRVTLSDTVDALGMPIARIDWRIADDEYRTAWRTTELLCGELGRLGYRVPEKAAWLAEGPDAFRANVHDMAHPMSSTRMSEEPETGVVDRNCRVHGVEGLYIAGSSVFSTPGYMNPTMMIVALGLRLADHLRNEIDRRRSGGVPSGEAKPAPLPAQVATPRRTRIGIIGAGDRLRRIYRPVLSARADAFEVVGFAGRSPERARAFAQDTGFAMFADTAALVAQAKPDMLVAAVSPDAVDSAWPGILDAGLPVLAETPFCWSVRGGRRIADLIARRGLLVGIAEQTPFLPAERIKTKVIELGLLGPFISAINDFAVFDYHGIAAVRAYAEPENDPVRVSAVQARLPREGAGGRDDPWTMAVVTLRNGARLVHHYSDAYFDAAMRQPKQIRVYGASGSIVGDTVYFGSGDGADRADIEREDAQGTLARLRVDTPGGPVVWENPYRGLPLDDEQIAVATHLDAMARVVAFGGVPAYGVQRALDDMEIMTSIRLSAGRDGGPVGVPVAAAELLARSAVGAMAIRLRR